MFLAGLFTDVAQFIAKAFLERDYEAIKAREAVPVTEDLAMNDVDQIMEQGAQPTEAVQVKTEQPTESGTAELKPDAGAPVSTEAIPEPQPNQDAPIKEDAQQDFNAPMDQSFPENTDGLNFDAALDGAAPSGSFGLSLDFGDDDMGNQAFLSGSAFGNNAPGDSKTGPTQPMDTSTTTAPAGGGAFDMELQKTENDPNGFPDQGNTMDDLMGPGESSFDDLFMETENMGEDGTDLNQLEGDSLMNLNELDDNWFT